MTDSHRIKFSLACLVMAALTGLVGFVIVYHYATFERPLERFAVVIDAGSTQTRSSLYALQLDASQLDNLWSAEDHSQASGQSLSDLAQVKQVSTCVNGGPLTGVQSIHDARLLFTGCLRKFAYLIMRLNFESSLSLQDQQVAQEELETLDVDEIGRRLAALDKRVNSVTRLYLGATAGMRALRELNSSAAHQKLGWVSEALSETNSLLGGTGQDLDAPYLNRAMVDIISGQEEATFGWISVNYVIDRLLLKQPTTGKSHINRPQTVGTLELGGASAQQAFELPVPDRNTSSLDKGLKVEELNLFGSNYWLATRSDLCLGMSQAILRADFTLLRDHYLRYKANGSFYEPSGRLGDEGEYELELENPCLQNKVRRSLINQGDPEDILSLPCLRPSRHEYDSDDFHGFITNHTVIRFVGTGEVDQCDRLLSRLIEPAECSQYFSLCPDSKNSRAPPAGQPFVTISGYNKALKVLDLDRAVEQKRPSKLEQMIADRLGGYSIDHGQFRRRSREFCQTDVSELPAKYPDMNQKFYPVNCLQLVYINKLLTDFYQFDPRSSWNQIKFLLFPAEDDSGQLLAGSRHSAKNDIGWTLGLLLNATSGQLADHHESSAHQKEPRAGEPDGVFYHHGATVAFVVRATLLLILACCLLSICLLLFGAIIVRKRQAGIYLNNHYSSA